MKSAEGQAFRLLPLAAVILALGCEGCGGGDGDERERLDLDGSITDTLYTIDDNTDVYVDGTLIFESSSDSSLFIGRNVVFHMGENADLVFSAPPNMPAGVGVKVRGQGGDTTWRRVVLGGVLDYHLANWTIEGGREGLVPQSSLVVLDGVSIRDCANYGIYNQGCDSLVLRDCELTGCRTALQIQAGACLAQRTRFTGGEIAIYNQGQGLTLSDCVISDFSNSGLYFTGGSDAPGTYRISHSLIENCDKGVYSISSRPFYFEDNIVRNCQYNDLILYLQITAYPWTLKRNNLLPVTDEASYTLSFRNSGPHLDMTDNWWGVADSASIRGLIQDSFNNPDVNGVVDFMPAASAAFAGAGPR